MRTSVHIERFGVRAAQVAVAAWTLAIGSQVVAAPSLQTVAVSIGEETNEPKACSVIEELVQLHLASLKRFVPLQSSKPDHRLQITCTTDALKASWMTAIRNGKKITYRLVAEGERPFNAKAEGLDADYPSLALLIMKDILGVLPWDGEIMALADKAPAYAKIQDVDFQTRLPKDWRRAYVTMSAGYANNDSLAHCLAIEVGQVESGKSGPFVSKAFGIVASIAPFQSFAEVWLPPGALAKRLLFRFADPNIKDRMVKRAKMICRQTLQLDDTGTIDSLLAGDFRAALSTEIIELNGINQRVGVNSYTFKANNGQRSRGIGAYVHNNVTIGDLFLVDFKLFKELQASTYSPAFMEQEFKSSLNLAEGYGNLFYNFDPEWLAYGGIGFFYTKINVPYEPPGGINLPETTTALQEDTTGNETTTETTITEIPTRPKTLVPALGFGTSFTGEDVSFNTRVSLSLSDAGPHTAFNMDLDYRLTRTWFTGLNLYLVRIGDTAAGAPGAVIPSAGAHIGFDLRRSRGTR